MTPTPTLDHQRTDQLQSFLVVEAAASVADRRPPALTPTRRRIAVGAATAALLAGGLVAASSLGGSPPAAIAVEVDGAWTTIRIVDIDADPDAVVAQLRAAGFAAEHRPLEVVRTDDGEKVTIASGDPAGGTDESGGLTVVNATAGGEGGEHGLVGLTVGLPEGILPAGAPGPGDAGAGPVHQATGESVTVLEESLEGAGLRFEPDGGISVRRGADVTIVVQTER